MDWVQEIFDQHGGTVLSVLVGMILVIVIIATLDGRKGDGRRGDGRNDTTHRDD